MRQNRCGGCRQPIRDCGPQPFVANIDCLAKMNTNYRTALWTGEHLQVTLMSIPAGGDIGLEMHDDVDQFIRIESGYALVQMGRCCDAFDSCLGSDSDNYIINNDPYFSSSLERR